MHYDVYLLMMHKRCTLYDDDEMSWWLSDLDDVQNFMFDDLTSSVEEQTLQYCSSVDDMVDEQMTSSSDE